MEIEEQARQQGWVDKEEYMGDPEDWKTAEDFVKDGEDINAILKERMGKLSDENVTLVKSIEKLKEDGTQTRETLAKFKEYHEKVEEKAHARALADLKKEKKVAREEGDLEKADEIDEEIDALKEEKDKEVKTEPVKADLGDLEIATATFEGKFPWVKEDLKVYQWAIGMGSAINQVKKPASHEEFFEFLEDELKREYPDKFENPKRMQKSPVDASTGKPPAKKTKKTYANLPEDARKECDRFVDEGLLTKEKFVKDYDWEE